MTIEEKVTQLLTADGLTKDEASNAIASFKESEGGKLMKGRWADPTEDYPPTLLTPLLADVERVLLEQILSPTQEKTTQ